MKYELLININSDSKLFYEGVKMFDQGTKSV